MRVSLEGTRAQRFDVYELEELEDGTIILRPLVALPPAELRARENPAVQAAVQAHDVSIASGAVELPPSL